jgi:protein SCO1/2
MNKRGWYGVFLVVALLLAYFGFEQLRENPKGGDFTLDSVQGQLSLHDLKGKWVVLYFGYASCPDVCPTNLGLWSQVFHNLTAAERAQLAFVFVSLDGERDQPQQLEHYVHYFHPDFMAATGDEAMMNRVAKQYGVKWAKVSSQSALGYTLDHSSYSYLVNPVGELVLMFRHATASDVLLKAIKARLQPDQ